MTPADIIEEIRYRMLKRRQVMRALRLPERMGSTSLQIILAAYANGGAIRKKELGFQVDAIHAKTLTAHGFVTIINERRKFGGRDEVIYTLTEKGKQSAKFAKEKLEKIAERVTAQMKEAV